MFQTFIKECKIISIWPLINVSKFSSKFQANLKDKNDFHEIENFHEVRRNIHPPTHLCKRQLLNTQKFIQKHELLVISDKLKMLCILILKRYHVLLRHENNTLNVKHSDSEQVRLSKKKKTQQGGYNNVIKHWMMRSLRSLTWVPWRISSPAQNDLLFERFFCLFVFAFLYCFIKCTRMLYTYVFIFLF